MNFTSPNTLLMMMSLILIARVIETTIAGRASFWQWHLLGVQSIALLSAALAPLWGEIDVGLAGLKAGLASFLMGIAMVTSLLVISTWHIGSVIPRSHR